MRQMASVARKILSCSVLSLIAGFAMASVTPRAEIYSPDAAPPAVDIALAIADEVPETLPEKGPEIPWAIEPARNIRIQLPGFSHHFSEPAAAKYGKKWNEKNYGAGIELRDPIEAAGWNKWSVLESAGFMKDSLGAWGSYAGAALQKRLINSDYTVDFGPSFWILYRTFDFGGPHLLTPAILPSLSIDHKPSGWGVNSILIPGFKWDNREMPTVLWVGITKAF
jgi:hypothetical protein